MASTDHNEIISEQMYELNMIVSLAELRAQGTDTGSAATASRNVYAQLASRAVDLATTRAAAVAMQREIQQVLDGTTFRADTHALQEYLDSAISATRQQKALNDAHEGYEHDMGRR